jgi:hypothetical protein
LSIPVSKFPTLDERNAQPHRAAVFAPSNHWIRSCVCLAAHPYADEKRKECAIPGNRNPISRSSNPYCGWAPQVTLNKRNERKPEEASSMLARNTHCVPAVLFAPDGVSLTYHRMCLYTKKNSQFKSLYVWLRYKEPDVWKSFCCFSRRPALSPSRTFPTDAEGEMFPSLTYFSCVSGSNIRTQVSGVFSWAPSCNC